MNNGLMGFPGGPIIATNRKRWWTYVAGTAQQLYMPTRAIGVAYYNDSGDDMLLCVNHQGASAVGADFGISTDPLRFMNYSSNTIDQDSKSFGLMYINVTSSDHHFQCTYLVPAGWWYKLSAFGATLLYNWSEFRIKY